MHSRCLYTTYCTVRLTGHANEIILFPFHEWPLHRISLILQSYFYLELFSNFEFQFEGHALYLKIVIAVFSSKPLALRCLWS
jgi:hypothetical protein